MTVKMSAFDYRRLSRWVKARKIAVPNSKEQEEDLEDLADRLEQKAEEINKKQSEALNPKEKKIWKCKACGQITTISMHKQCESCQALDSVKVVS